jgi:prophage regulatory protein
MAQKSVARSDLWSEAAPTSVERISASSIDEDTETQRLPRVRGNVSFRRTVRRAELRQIVPVADTTIYEMEQRGEFPRRFYLTPRCVVWDLAEVEAWVEQRRHASDSDMIKRAPSPDVRQRKSRPVRQ